MPLRSLLPWRRFTLDTAWSPADLERELGFLLDRPSALGDDTATERPRLAQAAVDTWYGSRRPEGFRIARRTPHRSLQPVASGKVHPTPTGSHVVVTVRLPVAATIFLAIGVPLLALLSVAVSVAALVRHDGIVLLIWTMPFSIWAGIVRPFLMEAHRTEEFLREFFPPPSPQSAGPFR
jgi:hypothetical protein